VTSADLASPTSGPPVGEPDGRVLYRDAERPDAPDSLARRIAGQRRGERHMTYVVADESWGSVADLCEARR
jgi:hypothetical protein